MPDKFNAGPFGDRALNRRAGRIRAALGLAALCVAIIGGFWIAGGLT